MGQGGQLCLQNGDKKIDRVKSVGARKEFFDCECLDSETARYVKALWIDVSRRQDSEYDIRLYYACSK